MAPADARATPPDNACQRSNFLAAIFLAACNSIFCARLLACLVCNLPRATPLKSSYVAAEIPTWVQNSPALSLKGVAPSCEAARQAPWNPPQAIFPPCLTAGYAANLDTVRRLLKAAALSNAPAKSVPSTKALLTFCPSASGSISSPVVARL